LSVISLRRNGISTTSYRDAIRDSRIATFANKLVWARKARWPFRLRFAQSRVAQLDLAPTLAAFASRSVISTPPRFERDYSAHARLAVFVETPRLGTSDAERDQGASRKPSLHAIRESRIASSRRAKMIDSFAPAHFGLSACPSISLDSHRLG